MKKDFIQNEIWELLGNLGYDLDEDKGASELADEAIHSISQTLYDFKQVVKIAEYVRASSKSTPSIKTKKIIKEYQELNEH